MQKYIDKDYYLREYKGTAKCEESLIIKASRYIQKYTSNRASSEIEAVKYCTCCIIDKIDEYDKKKIKIKENNNKKSESLGKWSITYQETEKNKEIEKDMEIEIIDIIKLYLSDITDKCGINLLYRGI